VWLCEISILDKRKYRRANRLEEAVRFVEEFNEDDRTFQCIYNYVKGFYEAFHKNFTEAKKYLEKALELALRMRLKDLLTAFICCELGYCCSRSGEFHIAKDFYEKAIEIAKKCKFREWEEEVKDRVIGIIYNNAATCYSFLCDTEKVDEYYKEAIKYFLKARDLGSLIGVYSNLAEFYRGIDKKKEAQNVIEEAKKYVSIMEQNPEIRDPWYLVTFYNNAGTLYCELKIWDVALNNYRKAKRIAEELGDDRLQAFILNNLGTLFIKLGRFDEATDELYNALIKMESLKELSARDIELINTIHKNMAEILCKIKGRRCGEILNNLSEWNKKKVKFVNKDPPSLKLLNSFRILESFEKAYKVLLLIFLISSLVFISVISRNYYLHQKFYTFENVFISGLFVITLCVIFTLIDATKRLKNMLK